MAEISDLCRMIKQFLFSKNFDIKYIINLRDYLSNKTLYIFISNYITTKDKYEINWNIRLCLIIMKAKTSIKGIS